MEFGRVRLYHADFPTGRVFTEKAEHDAAVKDGWVDAPWKIVQVAQEEQPEVALKPWQKAQAARKAKREGKPPNPD